MKKISNLFLIFNLAILSKVSFAVDLNGGLPGISDKLQKVTDTMTGPMAFIMSVAGLIVAAGTWKFAGHVAGIKFISGAIAGIIILVNVVSWVNLFFSGAVI